jgi:hypothetical protein
MMTPRTLEDGRLFAPIEWDHGWSLSLQADKAGYQCSPHERLAHIEDYEAVEGCLTGPFEMSVDVSTMDMPQNVRDKFGNTYDGMPAIGRNLTKEDVEHIKQAVLQASLNPNAGIPPGRYGWPGRSLYHGTSAEHAADIERDGVDPEKSYGGYFGKGFYMAEAEDLARSNYAEFNETDDAGAIITVDIRAEAMILDLRNGADFEVWKSLKVEPQQPDFLKVMKRNGIDGVYDRSFGGLVLYNTKAIEGEPRVEYLSSGPKI